MNRLDYVTCWFNKGVRYTAGNRSIEIAFVSTNSITQGEQCGVLWPVVFARELSIRFAHSTFQWNSEARGSAAVHCVIIGLTFAKDGKRSIYQYDNVRGEPHLSEVTRINDFSPTDGLVLCLPQGSHRPRCSAECSGYSQRPSLRAGTETRPYAAHHVLCRRGQPPAHRLCDLPQRGRPAERGPLRLFQRHCQQTAAGDILSHLCRVRRGRATPERR